jgi:hypothetical protein
LVRSYHWRAFPFRVNGKTSNGLSHLTYPQCPGSRKFAQTVGDDDKGLRLLFLRKCWFGPSLLTVGAAHRHQLRLVSMMA